MRFFFRKKKVSISPCCPLAVDNMLPDLRGFLCLSVFFWDRYSITPRRNPHHGVSAAPLVTLVRLARFVGAESP